jgi:tetratricopeptide (TPR) repeat protein
MNLKTAIVTFVLIFPFSEAIAETNWCLEYGKNKEYAQAIKACTSNINSGQNIGKDLANSYYNRAEAYSGLEDFDRAIFDYRLWLDQGMGELHNNWCRLNDSIDLLELGSDGLGRFQSMTSNTIRKTIREEAALVLLGA